MGGNMSLKEEDPVENFEINEEELHNYNIVENEPIDTKSSHTSPLFSQ